MGVCEFSDLADVLKRINDIKGVEAFRERGQVANIMTDLAPNMKVEVLVMNNLSKAGLLSEFAQYPCPDEHSREMIIYKAKHYLANDIGTRDDLIDRCVGALAEAFGWNGVSAEPAPFFEKPKITSGEPVVFSNEKTKEINTLLKRAAMFLEDKDYESCEEYCNKVLDSEPECAGAYFILAVSGFEQNSDKISKKAVRHLKQFSSNITEEVKRLINDRNYEDCFLACVKYGLTSGIKYIASVYPSVLGTWTRREKGCSVLYLAIIDYPNVDSIRTLLELGVDANSYSVDVNDKHSALSDAIYIAKNIEIVKLLLEYGAAPNCVEYRTGNDGSKYAKSLLTYSIIDAKSPEMVKLLLEYGADANSYRIYTNGDRYSALSDALWNVKNVEMVKLLLEYGADANRFEHLQDEDGYKFTKSMLTCAIVDAKSPEMVKLLLEHGADANSYRIRTNGDRYSALSDAIWNTKNVEMVKLLLSHGADVNRFEHLQDDDGYKFAKSMLTCAVVDARSPEMVKLLLEHGADANSYRIYINGDRYSALSDAIWNTKNVEMVKLLLEDGADANRLEHLQEDGYKFAKSMLTCAIVDAKNPEMIELLIEHGATWDNVITYDHKTKVERKYPYDKIYGIPADVIACIKRLGWKGSGWF